MTPIDSRSYCRVAVIAPSTRVDLALPTDIAIIDLMPMLLQYAGEDGDNGGGPPGGWKLMRVGQGELDGARTLRSLDVADGELLRLTPREEPTAAPVFDDILDVIATARRDRINPRSINPGVGAGVILAATAAAAITLFHRGVNVADAYVAGGIALVLLAVATAVARGTRDRIVATATAAGGLAFALVCALDAASRNLGRWSVLLGASSVLTYSLAAALLLGSGVIVFAASSTAAVLTGLSALVAGLTHAAPLHVVAGTIAVALAGLSVLPRFAIRLARLPLVTVPTTSHDGRADNDIDEIGDLAEVTARARLAGEYLTGTQIGSAATIGASALLLGVHASIMSIALAATATVAMALRARSAAGIGGRVALVASAVVSGLVAAVVIVVQNRDGDGIAVLVAELAVGALALALSTAWPARRPAPQTMRLVDLFESAVVVAVLPLAVGVMGLYTVLRRL